MRVVSRCVAFRCGGACAWMLALKNGGNALRVEKMGSHGGSERKGKMGSAREEVACPAEARKYTLAL